MINLTSILPERKNKVSPLHWLATLIFLALFAFPLFPLQVTNGMLMLLAAFTVTSFLIKPFPIGKILLRNLVFLIPFLPYLAEFILSGFDPGAGFEFEKKLFFFTAPLIIPVFLQLTGFRNYKLALLVFSFAVVLLTLFAFSVIMIHGIPFNAAAYENGAYLLRLNFEQVSGLHPTYYSLFALTAACVLCLNSTQAKQGLRVIFLASAALLFLSVLFLAVRIAFLTGAIFLLFWVVRQKMAWWKKLLLGLLSATILAFAALAVPSLKSRLSEIVSWAPGPVSNVNTISQRTTILHCSLKVFSDHLLSGTGNGNAQQALNDCYNAEGWPQSADRSFNPHNQFLSFGVSYGLFAMLVFIASLYFIFRKTFRLPEGVYCGIAMLMFFMSESLLERQMGVYFFGLTSLLIYHCVVLQTARAPGLNP